MWTQGMANQSNKSLCRTPQNINPWSTLCHRHRDKFSARSLPAINTTLVHHEMEYPRFNYINLEMMKGWRLAWTVTRHDYCTE